MNSGGFAGEVPLHGRLLSGIETGDLLVAVEFRRGPACRLREGAPGSVASASVLRSAAEPRRRHRPAPAAGRIDPAGRERGGRCRLRLDARTADRGAAAATASPPPAPRARPKAERKPVGSRLRRNPKRASNPNRRWDTPPPAPEPKVEAPRVVVDEAEAPKPREAKPQRVKPAPARAEERPAGRTTIKISVPIPTPKAAPGRPSDDGDIGAVWTPCSRPCGRPSSSAAPVRRRSRRPAVRSRTKWRSIRPPGPRSSRVSCPPRSASPVRSRRSSRRCASARRSARRWRPRPRLRRPAPRRSRGKVAAAAVVIALLVGGGAYAVVQRERIAALFRGRRHGADGDRADGRRPAGRHHVAGGAGAQDPRPPAAERRSAARGARRQPVATERVAAAEPEPARPRRRRDAAAGCAARGRDHAARGSGCRPAEPAPAADPLPPSPTPDAPRDRDRRDGREPSTEPPPAAITPPPATATTAEPAGARPSRRPRPNRLRPPRPTPPAATAPAATPSTPAVIVAQRAILYEEPIPGSDGARVDGQVLWTLVNEPDAARRGARAADPCHDRGADRKLKLVLSLRRNTDAALPASHIAELRFGPAGRLPGPGIETTPGLILKLTDGRRGDPLIGAVAKVSDNLFWLALSRCGPGRRPQRRPPQGARVDRRADPLPQPPPRDLTFEKGTRERRCSRRRCRPGGSEGA